MIKILLSALFFLAPVAAIAEGGGSGVGGGGGFIKFAAGSESCKQVDTASCSIDQVDKVISLDFWELQFRDPIEDLINGETAGQYLRRVLTYNFELTNARFLRLLLETLNEVESANWTNRKIERIEDQGIILGAPQKQGFLPVQIIVRESRFNPGYKSKIQFLFNQELYEKISELDRALLLLHEAIYVIAADIGHDKSEKVRQLAALLLKKSTRKSGVTYHVRSATQQFEWLLENLEFGVHSDLYSSEYSAHPSKHLLVRKKEALERAVKKFHFNIVQSDTKKKLKYSDEEMFYLAWSFSRSFALKNLMTLEQYLASPNLEIEQVKLFCNHLKYNSRQGANDFDQALGYCRKILRLKLVSAPSVHYKLSR